MVEAAADHLAVLRPGVVCVQSGLYVRKALAPLAMLLRGLLCKPSQKLRPVLSRGTQRSWCPLHTTRTAWSAQTSRHGTFAGPVAPLTKKEKPEYEGAYEEW